MPLQHESVLQRYFYRSIRTENLWMEVIEDGRNNFLCGRVHGPGIGFVLQDESIPDYSDNRWPLYQGGGIAQDMIDLIPAYRDHPLVKQAVEDIKPYLKKLERAGKKKCDLER